MTPPDWGLQFFPKRSTIDSGRCPVLSPWHLPFNRHPQQAQRQQCGDCQRRVALPSKGQRQPGQQVSREQNGASGPTSGRFRPGGSGQEQEQIIVVQQIGVYQQGKHNCQRHQHTRVAALRVKPPEEQGQQSYPQRNAEQARPDWCWPARSAGAAGDVGRLAHRPQVCTPGFHGNAGANPDTSAASGNRPAGRPGPALRPVKRRRRARRAKAGGARQASQLNPPARQTARCAV